MAKILVKQVQPQLMQTPGKEGKGFMDFFNTFRNKDKNPNVGVKQRLAGLAGMAGKVGAGLSTVNDTMHAMQGGNISAPLGMGYTFEAKDPTGRMISEAANPNAPPAPAEPAPTPRHVNVGVGGNYDASQITPFNPFPSLSANPTTAHLNYQSPAPAAPQPAAPATPQMPQMPPPLPVEQPIPPLPAPASAAPPPLVTGPNPPPVPSYPAPGYPVKPDFDINNLNQDQKSFVTALTEKLGADMVYKMSPHEIGTFAAYTLLKLR